MSGPNAIHCHVQTAVDVIGGKWKPWILWHLYDGARRFGELQRLTPGITRKMLTQHLRELEKDGIIARKVYPQKPAKVEYSFTAYGATLRPILKDLCRWGATHADHAAAEPPRPAGRRKGRPAALADASAPGANPSKLISATLSLNNHRSNAL